MVSTPLKILVKLDHFPRDRGENKRYLKPPPSFFYKLELFLKKILGFLHNDVVFFFSKMVVFEPILHLKKYEPNLKVVAASETTINSRPKPSYCQKIFRIGSIGSTQGARDPNPPDITQTIERLTITSWWFQPL